MVRMILTLAWPTMLEQLMQTAVQYIDTAMVGSLGTHATAAVGATTTVGWLIGGFLSSVGVGFLSTIARAYGAKDKETASRAVAQAVLAVLFMGTLFTVLPLSLSGLVPVWMQVDPVIRPLASQYFFILYITMLPRTASIIFGTVLRAAGDTRTPMKVGVLVNLVNVVLNFFCIYPTRQTEFFGMTMTMPGLGMGVVGAAAASAAAFLVGGICMTAALWKHPLVSPKGRKLTPDWQILKPCLRIALPNMLQRFGTSMGYVTFASMINALGDISTAAHTIANTVESAFYIPGYGMQTAAATLAGNAYGAGDKKQMNDLAKMFIPIEVTLMILSGGLLFMFAPGLVGVFSDAEDVIRLGTTVLRMVAVSEPFFGFSIIMEGFLLGTGNTREPFFYNIIGMWGVRIVGTFLCTKVWHMNLIAAWACMILHNLLIFALYCICYLRRKWNPLAGK
ncbi:MAG: MATE family efflux transporter [Clostridia bacterium]|nr:MATE family efflux transporter [Clostridia bacterium]